MKFFSIIMCVYNTDKYLRRALDSIVNQDFNDYELIIIDDGSTDNSPNIIDEYKKDNVIIIHKENEGLSLSRNHGMKYASGKYIWFVDSDDEIEEDALSFMHLALLQSDADILRINYRRIEKDNRIRVIDYPSDIFEGDNLSIFKHKAISNSYRKLFTCWSHIYKRELIKDVSFISEKEVKYEDIVFNIIVYVKAKSIQVVDAIFYRYYLREGSLTRSLKRYSNKLLNAYQEIKNKLIELDYFDEYKKDICVPLLNSALLGEGIGYYGSLVFDCLDANSIEEAYSNIKEVLESNQFKEIFELGTLENVNENLKEEYKIIKNNDVEGLYAYYRTLAIGEENNN